MQKLLQKAKAKEIDCIIVKRLFAVWQDYITVSDYVDQIFRFSASALFRSTMAMTAKNERQDQWCGILLSAT